MCIRDRFKGFSSAAQHDMVLDALVRITKNLETIEKESGKPFVGTVKQRRNDVKLLTILAEAFGKNELVWKHSESTRYEVKMIDATNDNRKGSRNTFSEMTNAKEKIESAQQSSGNFMSCKSSTDTTSYPDELVKRS